MEQDHEESRRMTILCLCIGLILLGTALFVFDPFSLREEEKPVVVTAGAGNNEKDDKLLVYVVGAVKEPGVYELPKGSHYYDAVKAAGDVLPYAEVEAVNMAAPIENSMKIYIPLNPDRSDPAARGLININTAGAKELEALPGVGAVTAEKIVKYRQENGYFTEKQDLKKVPSISDGRYAKLADKITL